MRGFWRVAVLLLLAVGSMAAVAADPPATRLDVVQETNGECRYRWILEPGETRLVYCDLSTLVLGRVSAVVESGNYAVPGSVSETFDAPSGAIAVLHNGTDRRQRGASRIRPVTVPISDSF